MNSRNTKLFAVFLVVSLLFNFPIVGIFLKKTPTQGMPISWIYIFVVWFFIILWVRQVADIGFRKQELIDKNRKSKK